MSIGTLDDIITKARKLSGTATDFQLTDAQIIDYVNSFYLYDFPAQFRSLKLKDIYTFNTIRGINVYPFDSEGYTTIQQPVTCAKRPIQLFQSPNNFWGMWYNWQFQQNFAIGTGNIGTTYTGIAQNTPIIRSVNNNPGTIQPLPYPGIPYPASRVQNILITVNNSLGNTLNVTDDGFGNLIGNIDPAGVNTINYETGAISVKFGDGINPISVTAGQSIQLQYIPTNMTIPQGVLFFQNQFTFMPCPDQGYTIEMVAYRQPSQALLKSQEGTEDLTGTPELIEWWECLACGAAKKIYEDRLDTDGIMVMDKMLEERYQVAYTRTYAELGKQQAQTIFRDQLNNNYLLGYGWFGQGGN